MGGIFMSGTAICVLCGTKRVFDHFRPNTRHNNWKCRPCAHKGLPTWNTGLSGSDHPGLKKIGEAAKKHWTPERRKSHRKYMEETGWWTPLSAKTGWKAYKQLCWYYTNQNDLSQLENYDKVTHTTGGSGYTLDHKFSVHEGFKNSILPQIIGSIVNLQYITCSENSSKHTKCSITKEELYEEYDRFTKSW